MKKTCSLLIVSLLLLYSFSGFALAIKNQYPQRIVSGIPSITEILFSLGLDKEIVGVTTNCNYPPAALKKEKVGRETLSVEKILSLNPDLIVLLYKTQDLDRKHLEAYKLPVISVKTGSYQEIKMTILDLGKLTGKEYLANKVVASMDQKINSINISKERPKVLVLVGWKPLVTIGAHSFINQMVQFAGGYNVASMAKGDYPILSFEEILRLNPDLIILPTNLVNVEKEIYNEARWSGVTAVKNRKVYTVDVDLISRPGPRFADAVIEINKVINRVK